MLWKVQSRFNPNSLGGGCPFQARMADGGFASYAERIDGKKVRARSKSFFDHFKTRQVAILATNGVDDSLMKMKTALEAKGATVKVVALRLGTFASADNKPIKADQAFLGSSSVLFDAVFVPGGSKSIDALKNEPNAILFINEAYRPCKAIAATAEGADLLSATFAGQKIKGKNKNDNGLPSLGIITGKSYKPGIATSFINAIA